MYVVYYCRVTRVQGHCSRSTIIRFERWAVRYGTDLWKSISFRCRSRRALRQRCRGCRRSPRLCPSGTRRPLSCRCTASIFYLWRSTFCRSCTWTPRQCCRAARTTCPRWAWEILVRVRCRSISNNNRLQATPYHYCYYYYHRTGLLW